MSDRMGDRRRILLPGAIRWGVLIGVVGAPATYLVLRSFRLLIFDASLVVCLLVAPLVLLALASRKGRRAWYLQASAAAAAAGVVLVLLIGGGIGLLSAMLSDP